MSPVASRADKKARTRKALIDAAVRLSAEYGFSGLSLREVTREADLAPTTFYRHFTDMDDLGLTLIDEVGLSLRRLMRQAGQRAGTERNIVKAEVEAFLAFIHEQTNLFRLLVGERSGSSSAFRKALHREMDRFIGEFTEVLEQQSQVKGKPLVDAALTAEAIVAVVFNVGAESLDLPAHSRKQLVERILKEVQIIICGAETITKAELSRI